eukprot:TRINITY_DN111034_c0_g1_i1.p1 TRINITY_DN111034_c0_g1~~TRINITY_DN111034_c0_g1_i1.p1  ORF type:complete len:578 (+),score=110.18 TRINITY_DN111034_c0_g1_i1:65-1798(+)
MGISCSISCRCPCVEGHEEVLQEHLLVAVADVCRGVVGPRRRAIAMQGGGFRAQMSDLGLIAGLLATSGATCLSGSNIFAGFDTLSTCSGSSWFAASLIYSPSFVALLENMAQKQNRGEAAKLFHNQWVTPWLALAKEDNPAMKILAAAVDLFDEGLAEDIALFGYFWQDGFSWYHIIETLLQQTANIDPTTTMGSPTCPWAQSKTWICNATLLAPTTAEEAVNVWHANFPRRSHATYKLENFSVPAEAVPTSTPARFAVTLGTRDPAPLSLISSDGLLLDATLKHTGVVSHPVRHDETFTASSGAIEGFPVARNTMADIPVAGSVAASSAFLGQIVLDGKVAVEAQKLQLCPWFSNAAGADSFAKAMSLVQRLHDANAVGQSDLNDLAEFQLHGLTDAGNSDGTGLLNAISVNSDCDEVTVVLNTTYLDKVPSYLLKMFAGYEYDPSLYPGEPPRGSDQILFPRSGVFASPSADAFRDAFAQDKCFFDIPPLKDAKYFLGIKAGTIQARTNGSKWFNILADIDVTINVVSVASNVTIGQLEDFDNYGALAEEIIRAINDKGATDASKKLLSMFAAA